MQRKKAFKGKEPIVLIVKEFPLDVRQLEANPAAAFADLDLCYIYLLWVQGDKS